MTPEDPSRHLAFGLTSVRKNGDAMVSWGLELGLGGSGLVLVANANLYLGNSSDTMSRGRGEIDAALFMMTLCIDELLSL